MPRPKTVLQSNFPYHVGARAPNKELFPIPQETVWRIMSCQLTYISWIYGARIHAFTLMGNHFHLLISTPQANLSEIMHHFMRETSRSINYQSKRINQAWGSRHFRCLIDSDHYFLQVYKYVYRNPVNAGLAKSCETYPYSTLQTLLGRDKMAIPLTEDQIFFSSSEKTLSWLNEEPSFENWNTIETSLRRQKFKLPKTNDNRPHELERSLL